MIGFLHSPKPGRASLAYDVLELHRAAITHAVFAYVQRRIFLRADFELTVDGIVWLSAPVAREVAILALRAVPMADAVRTVKRLAARL
jgi:CRISPR/Cas system-associated endonuclease Cas1